jgi:hypothetical protein
VDWILFLLVAIQVFCPGIESEKSFGKKKPFYSTPTYKNNQHISSVQGISLFKEISSAFKKKSNQRSFKVFTISKLFYHWILLQMTFSPILSYLEM